MVNSDKLVIAPADPPESMWDGLPRDIFLGFDMGIKDGDTMIEHLNRCGNTIPESVLNELKGKGHLTKGDRAVVVYKAMIAQRPVIVSDINTAAAGLIQQLFDSIEVKNNALEIAENGLRWYMENSDQANESDEEAMTTIQEAQKA